VDTLRGFALEQVSVREMVLPLVTITIIGFFLTFLARSARRTIEDVVALEAKNLRMVKEQAELVMDVKMTGLATMVAGVAHEINTPLGVTLSSVGNLESCAHKMEDVLGENRKLRPVLDAHKENTGTIRKAGQRISGVVHSLRNFARLDEAEVQKADVRVGLDSTLALALPENAGHVEVVKEYKDVPLIYCRPKELNQVFLTIITNALEAMEGKGTLGIRVGGDSQHVDIRIADSGKGIPADRLQSLFDLHFAASKGRIAMGLGLPTAKKIIDRAGGTILAESEVGKGTTFVISLPVSGL